ncbi:hypothetical protein [Novilysobacter spongiicola]|uniref:WD40-like Beta Propeller Repeat n=1 Tax=Lysobacter spongiicola DSM 21749 TaxID=1122188 RepID=A0A1T4RVI0_9GAMM|nr:hypothetical protein [Lysobacter spongiicola]SKA19955.1 hypothetical protein SAMN02745674_02393 [Lysobacter spongiicola DSM 21749]
MKQVFCSMLIGVVLVACISVVGAVGREQAAMNAGSFQSSDPTEGLGCEAGTGVSGCLRQHEASAAAQHGIELSRTARAFCLASSIGEACLPAHDRLAYAFLERVGGHYVVVEVFDQEGFEVLLLDPGAGRKHRIDNRPLFSPDGSVFATVSYDIDAGYGPNRVAIWDPVTGEVLHQVDRFAPGSGPVGIRWVAPAKLEVLYHLPRDEPGSSPLNTFDISSRAHSWADNHAEVSP